MLFCVLFVDVMQRNPRRPSVMQRNTRRASEEPVEDFRRAPTFWVRGVSHHIGQMLWGRDLPEGPSKILGELLAAVPNFCETMDSDLQGDEED